VLYVAVLGGCHGQSLLAVEHCLGVQNNTWIVKVLEDDCMLRYCFSVLKEREPNLTVVVGIFVLQ
jgi:hypothetical protein